MMRTVSGKLLTALCLILLTTGAYAQTSFKKTPGHPRLLLMKGEERALKADIRKDSLWTAVHDSILEQARSYIGMPLLERKKEGLRLLGVSREALKRIFRKSFGLYSEKALSFLGFLRLIQLSLGSAGTYPC